MKMIYAALVAIAVTLGQSAKAESGSISVQGQGEVSVAPDMARITLGVSHRAKTATAAVDLMTEGMAAVLDQLAQAGIAPADVQTTGLRVDAIQDYSSATGTSRITGYVAATQVRVHVMALADLPQVLDAVLANGANQMNGLQFDVADRAPHIDAARRAAVMSGRDKALLYADAAGVTLGALQSLSEAGGGGPRPMMMMDAEMSRSGGVPVAEGEITITAQVSMVYAIGE